MERRIAVYSRKSRFTGKGESIENQVGLCREYIRLHFGEAAAENAFIYEDEGFSGGNLKRPRFRAMMEDAKKGRISAVVVYRLDRISRNIGDFAGLIEELNALDVSFLSIREQFDTSSPMGRAMMYIASVFSQLERETIAERIRDNMQELSKTGRWLGGTTPTGYASESVTRVNVDGKTKKACRLKLIPGEGELIREIYRSFLASGSLKETEAALLQKGARTKNGREFTRFAIKAILTNPVYMRADEAAFRYFSERGTDLCSPREAFDGKHGLIAYNRTLQRQGKTNQLRDIQEWIVSVGGHEGLIPGEDWVKVQSLLGQNCSKGYRKPRGQTALLSGLLVCGSCQSFMRPKLTGRLDREGKPTYTYLCTKKEKSRGTDCRMKNVNGKALDDAVIQRLSGISEDQEEMVRRLKRYERECLEGESEEREKKRLLERKAELEGEIKCLVKAMGKAEKTAAQEYLLEQVEELHESVRKVEQELNELELRAREREGRDVIQETELAVLRSFETVFREMDLVQQRLALKSLVEKIIWDGECAQVYLRGGKEAGNFGENGV